MLNPAEDESSQYIRHFIYTHTQREAKNATKQNIKQRASNHFHENKSKLFVLVCTHSWNWKYYTQTF